MKAILDSPDLKLDGFLGPGHVSTAIGTRPYEFVPKQYGKPVVVSGFEPLDILQSVYLIEHKVRMSASSARPGDKIILSGTMGDHGTTIMVARGELDLETEIYSDAAPLWSLVQAMLEASQDIHVLRDPTRGGVATNLTASS